MADKMYIFLVSHETIHKYGNWMFQSLDDLVGLIRKPILTEVHEALWRH